LSDHQKCYRDDDEGYIMANAEEDEIKMKVHPLSSDPEKCYRDEKGKGRYAKIRLAEQKHTTKMKKADNVVRFVCISDTHNRDQIERLHERIPEGDVLIHAGDFAGNSDDIAAEIADFNTFIGQIKNKFKHIVVIAGNHEISFDERTWNKYKLESYLTPRQSRCSLTNCTYIQDEGIELYGIKIYGSPWQPVHLKILSQL